MSGFAVVSDELGPVIPVRCIWFHLDRDTRACLLAWATLDMEGVSPVYYDGTPFENLPADVQERIASYLANRREAVRGCYKAAS